MTKGLEIRAAIDAETVKGLIQINGGGAVAILALLPSILNNLDYLGMAVPLFEAVFCFAFGLVFAITHNQLRRECSLLFERSQFQPPSGKILGFQLRQPTICFWSRAFMWLSMAAFIAGILVAAFQLYQFATTTPLAHPYK